jgi:hypothetical protein
MNVMRRGWAVVAVAAAVTVVAGCGGGSDQADAEVSPSVSSPAVTPSSAEPEVVAPSTPEYPPGPEGEIDAKADTEGWVYDTIYSSASAFVQDICDSLPVSAIDGASRPQWLVESGQMDGDGEAMLSFGIPKLCPKWTKTVKAAVSGDYERWYGAGDYEVVKNPAPYDPEADSDVLQMGPGTYRATGKFEDCYWERTSAGGDIIENQFVTQARRITVTLRVGELFRNECGVFKPVG